MLLVVFIWWIPVIYTQKAVIPPLETMNRSEGVLSFTGGMKRPGRLMVLIEDDGTKHRFACNVIAVASATCGGQEHAGKRAVVWWHPFDLHPLWTIKHPAQIEVDGKFLLTYERTLGKLASAKTNEPWFAFGTTVFFLIMLIVVYKIERRFHELSNR